MTSIDADGTRDGYDLELTRQIAADVEVPVIASGGAGEARHLGEAFAAGAESPLPEMEIQYGDYADWERETLQGDYLAGLSAFWRERLAGRGAEEPATPDPVAV